MLENPIRYFSQFGRSPDFHRSNLMCLRQINEHGAFHEINYRQNGHDLYANWH